MKRSRNEVARWRLKRQAQKRKSRWLEGQSRRYRHIYRIRAIHSLQHQHLALYHVIHGW
ncbi:YciY family protein [Rouxiella sp. T17]|uniref:Uncharacterized protein YciY n=1 Tax=Rouxiella chamberiensis TaxID=1513468 RepID=A0ABY7HTN6_9GAMM|nr:YciY family protein [Rouxiella chamberiensis]WAT02715.1 YciY family protein [Rouxiella chamberiensis]